MIRDNIWFQLVLFFTFLLGGIFYVIAGAKKKDKKGLIAGILLLTFGWTKAALLLQHLDLDPLLQTILEISEFIVPLAGMIVLAIYIRKWRPYILGLGIFLIIVIGVAYMHVSDGSP